MKKIWMLSMLAIALLFSVSCGGGDGEETTSIAGTNCDAAGTFSCENNVVFKCEDDSWKQVKMCPSTQECNAEKGTCEAENADTGDTDTDTGDTGTDTGDTDTDTGDTGNNGGGNGGNNGGGNGGNNDGKYNCKQYADCLNGCNSDPNYDSCRQQCFNNTSAQESQKYNDLYYCGKDNGCLNLMSDDQAYTECMNTKCADEIEACGMGGGSGTDADSRYNPSYGHLTLNFSVDQIATPSDQEAQKEQGSDNKFGRVDGQFAFGKYGNNNLSDVIPVATDQILSSAGYRNEDGFEGVSISQTFAVQTGADGQGNPQYAMANPAVVLKIDKTAYAVAQIDVSPFNNPKALIQVLHMNWDTSEVVCVHAYGEGTLNITNATGDIANHGSLAFTGEVDLYNMRNYKGYSYDQNNDACDPVD